MKKSLWKVTKTLLSLALVLIALGLPARAQAPTPAPLTAVISLTGGPNPSPAVIGNTVRCRWSARVDGAPTTRAECLTEKATYNWSVEGLTWMPVGGAAQSQPAGGVTLTPTDATAATSFVPDKEGMWEITVKVAISYSGTECGGAWSGDDTEKAGVQVQGFVLHPSASDFVPAGIQDGAARVLISKTRGDAYYSTNNTTRANTHAQNSDGKVTITAHLPPEGDGSTIYFRVIDPDDASPYETDPAEGDNAFTHALSLPSDKAKLVENLSGNQVAAAETVLSFGTYSGDNFIVEASGDPTFPAAATQRTPILVAWKRAYLEVDNMFQQGATVVRKTLISSGATTLLPVDNVEDFAALPDVTIFTPGGLTIARKVLAVDSSDKTIVVDKIGVELPQYTGVKLATNWNVYEAPRDLIPQGFGAHADGRDGGAFVEFVHPIQGSRSVPKFTTFPNLDRISLSGPSHLYYSLAWFKNTVPHDSSTPNTFQLLTAREAEHAPDRESDTGGITSSGNHTSTVFVQTPSRGIYTGSLFSPALQREIVVHELGHLFPPLDTIGENGHVDLSSQPLNGKPAGSDAPDVEGRQNCIMYYDRDFETGTAKFDIECYKDIRGATDPLE
jgi:hypothetical protein